MTKRSMFIRMVLSSILRRRSRVLIAMLAVAIGATTLSSLAMIAIDVPRQMAREMRSYGANVVVLPADEDSGFSPAILADIDREVPADLLVGAVGLEYEPITINDLPYVAVGTDMEAARAINPYWYVDGEWPHQPGQALIGREIAQATDVGVGDTLTLMELVDSGQSLEAAGEAAPPAMTDEQPRQPDARGEVQPGQVTDEMGKPIAPADKTVTDAAPGGGLEVPSLPVTISGILETGGSEDGFVYLASADLSELTGRDHMLTVAELSVAANETTIASIAQDITSKHPEIQAAPVARLTHSDANVLDMLRSLMVIITIIVLALIMIGVSTTMMAVVTERRNEIGLRKALGAGNRSIVGEFLGEAVVLGIVGGFFGALMGYGLAQVISLNVFHRTVVFQPLVFIATIVVSVVISTLASLIPVRRAIDVDPALVLRGE
ncbi:MAG: FtsX-like permease family protein [Actinomycetaceae bacterium]|nr:FtsX-like permease family protein [Actinomycetaceae bacterium]